jgi:N-acetylmuramoyl-L-alanine amidase
VCTARSCYPSEESAPIDSDAASLLKSRRTAAFAAAFALLFQAVSVSARAEERATILWRGESHPVGTLAGKEFVVSDAARALGFEVSSDPATGVLTLTGHGHKLLVGAGTAQVPVDQRLVSISKPARTVAGALYAPADFFEKVLFPLAGATGSYDASRRAWTLSEGGALAIETAVVHVEPVTQVVFKQSVPAKFSTVPDASAVQIRWPGQTVVAPFAERRYDDPFVAGVRFAGDVATIEFRDTGLTARAYALTAPDRVVVEIARTAAAGQAPPPPLPADTTLTVVIDPGHGGTETGAIGVGGLQEKQATLEIGRKLAATLPRVLSCRVVLTREADSLISLDDRTSVANHEKADLFLSVHTNSSRAAGARGSETYYLSLEASDKLAQEVASRENEPTAATATPLPGSATNHDLDFILWDLAQSAHLKESSELAEAIQNELNVVSGTENRGIKQAPFRVLVGASMPAVLIETAFISNPDEEKKLASPEFQQSVADAVAKAVARFFALRRPSVVRAPATTPAPAPPR